MNKKLQQIFVCLLLVTVTPTLSIEPVSLFTSWIGGKFLKMGLQKAKEKLEAPARDFFNESIYQLQSWDARRKRDKELHQAHEDFKNKAKEDRRGNIDTFNQHIQAIGSLTDPETKTVATFVKKQDDKFNKLLLEFDTAYKKELEILNTKADIAAAEQYKKEITLEKSQKKELGELETLHDKQLKSFSSLSTREYNRITQEQREQRKCTRQDHEKDFNDLEQEHQNKDAEENTKLQSLKDNLLSIQKTDIKTFLKSENENQAYFIHTLKANREKRITSQIIVGAVALVALIAKGIYSAYVKPTPLVVATNPSRSSWWPYHE